MKSKPRCQLRHDQESKIFKKVKENAKFSFLFIFFLVRGREGREKN